MESASASCTDTCAVQLRQAALDGDSRAPEGDMELLKISRESDMSTAASSGPASSPSLPGTVGTPTDCMVAFAVDLSPMERIAWGDGPMKISP